MHAHFVFYNVYIHEGKDSSTIVGVITLLILHVNQGSSQLGLAYQAIQNKQVSL